MKINRKELLKALNFMQKVPKGEEVPICDNVFLKVIDHTTLSIEFTNRSMYAYCRIDCRIGNFVDCLTDRDLLIKIIRSMWDEEIELEYENGGEGLGIYGKDCEVIIPVVAGGPTSFPQFICNEDMLSINMPRPIFERFLSEGRGFVAEDDLRPVLKGILILSAGGKLEAAATDAHRLYYGWAFDVVEDNWSMNIPSSSFNAIEAMLKQSSGGFNISLSERWAQIESGRFHLNIRLIDGAYPNFHSVIPVYRKENVIEVDKLELMRAIRLVSIGANQATGLLKLEAHSDYKSLTITGKDDDWVTRSSAEISTKDADAVDALCRVGLKGVFLTKTLKMITTQKVRLHIADKTRCILVKPEDDRGYLTLLMPMILTD